MKSRHLFLPKAFYLCLSFFRHRCCFSSHSVSSFSFFPPSYFQTTAISSPLSTCSLSNLPLCPNNCLIFPMMIWPINLDKATGCSLSVEQETRTGTGRDRRWGMTPAHKFVPFFDVLRPLGGRILVDWERLFHRDSLEWSAEVLFVIIDLSAFGQQSS